MYDKLTKKDIEMMEAELEDRRLNQRPKIMEEVKRTREYGDLSENYEYKAAKQAQRQNDSRVRYLQNMIKTAQVIDDTAADTGRVKLYDKVRIYMREDDETMEIQVVSTVRTNPQAGLVSLESPLGRVVLGSKAGDTVHVQVSEQYAYDAEILSVTPATDDGSAPLLPF